MISTMPYWWESNPAESFWCEVTDRQDIGADLKCPTTDESGKPYWSYSLIRHIWPGDIVFHYSTLAKAFVGASVAGGPLEERPIVWTPHGTYGRGAQNNAPRPGWWLPLYEYRKASPPLPLARLAKGADRPWIVSWVDTMKTQHDFVAAPLTRYGSVLRAGQGYLFKMPSEWVDRWPELSQLAAAHADKQDELIPLGATFEPVELKDRRRLSSGIDAVRFKSSEDYEVVVAGGVQRRSRRHEALIKFAFGVFQGQGGVASMPHPVDLMLASPLLVILEAKTVGARPALLAVREAVGQLLEYRHFQGPREAQLGIILERAPRAGLVAYVEDVLGFFLMWKEGDALIGGPKTVAALGTAGVRAP
jgi:hypothetical protein